jgi:hypothetical protein
MIPSRAMTPRPDRINFDRRQIDRLRRQVYAQRDRLAGEAAAEQVMKGDRFGESLRVCRVGNDPRLELRVIGLG